MSDTKCQDKSGGEVPNPHALRVTLETMKSARRQRVKKAA
jgi:hypothetical protein